MLTPQEKDIVMSILIKLCKNSSTYFNSNFGTNTNALYIDGCIEYSSEEEKVVIKKWMQENNITDFKEEE